VDLSALQGPAPNPLIFHRPRMDCSSVCLYGTRSLALFNRNKASIDSDAASPTMNGLPFCLAP
jgi:hypothetical protein